MADIREHPGEGLSGIHNGQTVRLGHTSFVGARDGADGLWIGYAGANARFTFTHALRPGAAKIVESFKQAGLPVTLLSGDTPSQTPAIARALGIDDWRARATPSSKAAFLQDLAQKGAKPLMVGDGLNDTAALAAAYVSASPASAAEASRAAADLVLLGSDTALITRTWRIARAARARILENFRLATLYNVIAVPVAMAGLCSPLIAAVAMSLSSLTVTLNALRLTREPT